MAPQLSWSPQSLVIKLKDRIAVPNRANHTRMIRPYISKNEVFKYSFFVHSIEELNLLPEELTKISETQSFVKAWLSSAVKLINHTVIDLPSGIF